MRGSRLRTPVVIGAPIGLAVIASSLLKGGFTPGSQAILIVLAALGLLAAANLDPSGLWASTRRSPHAGTLLALGVVALASATWTLGQPGDALLWGLVILAYAAIAVTAATVAAYVGPVPCAVLIAALATSEAVIGLGFDATHTLPDAERIGVTWRPGGTFEYSSALALLQVAALPICLLGAQRRGPVAALAALGAVLAGAVLGCAGSRLALVLAAMVLAVVIAVVGRERRGGAVLLTALVLLAGLGADLILARRSSLGIGGGLSRLAAITAVSGALLATWAAVRTGARVWRPPLRVLAVLAAVLALFALAGVLTAGSATGRAGRSGDVAHGRLSEWRAAFETWLDRPVLGAGTGAYFVASSQHQGTAPVEFAHDLPLELAAELGILGLSLGLCLYAAGGHLLWATRRNPSVLLLGPTVAAFLVANLVDWPWHLAGSALRGRRRQAPSPGPMATRAGRDGAQSAKL